MLFQQLFCVIIFFGCQWGWIHKLAHFFWFWADCEKHTYCCIFPTFKITWTKGFENHLRPASHSCASSPSIYCHLVFIPLLQFISCILYRYRSGVTLCVTPDRSTHERLLCHVSLPPAWLCEMEGGKDVRVESAPYSCSTCDGGEVPARNLTRRNRKVRSLSTSSASTSFEYR